MYDFPELKNDLILRLIKGENVERIPIWIMRQAGRYLPEFREMRKQYDFFQLVQTPELCSEITIQPITRYDFDAAIIFSDILIVCQAMGIEVEMHPGKGPVIKNPLNDPSDLKFNLNYEESFSYLCEGINLTRLKLDGCCPLIGFCGAPWTLMCYMTDTSMGSSSRNFSASRKWLYSYPEKTKFLLNEIAEIVGKLLVEQAKSGAQSHAELLNRKLFFDFEMDPLIKIHQVVRQHKVEVPLIFYSKGGHYIVDDMLKSHYDVIGMDWTIDPSSIGITTKTLMGNMDPSALYGSTTMLKETVNSVVESFKNHNHIFNLGHGIYPDIDPENVKVLVDFVKNYSKTY